MQYLSVRNVTRNTELGQKVRIASSLVTRAIGLLGTRSLGPGEGLWLAPCVSIHTFFMRYPIDILFIDAQNIVLGQKTLPPWRTSPWFMKSRGVLELAAGTLAQTGTQIGDRVEFKSID